eukprot:6044297-Pyramimonas_sp.AAC.1
MIPCVNKRHPIASQQSVGKSPRCCPIPMPRPDSRWSSQILRGPHVKQLKANIGCQHARPVANFRNDHPFYPLTC